MSNHLKLTDVSLIGAGPMAVAYARVLTEQQVNFQVIGRGASSADSFQHETGIAVQTGGLERWLQDSPSVPEAAIVAVAPRQMAATTRALLQAGTRRLLLEKPAALTLAELGDLVEARRRTEAEVFVAYNRRHYASTRRAEELIEQDGGVLSFCFDFTEWSHRVEALEKPAEAEFAQWFVMNSSHVVDLAFFLGGQPVSFQSWTRGGLDWHPAASVFSGSGVTKRDALFTYHANWEAPGRWGVEMMTRRHKLVLRPLEVLHVQQHGSLDATAIPVEDEIDQRFKPGLFRQVEEFLAASPNKRTPTLNEHHQFWAQVLSSIVSPVPERNSHAA